MVLSRSRKIMLRVSVGLLLAMVITGLSSCSTAGGSWWRMGLNAPPSEIRQFYFAAYDPNESSLQLRMYNVSMGGDFSDALTTEPEVWFEPGDFQLLFGRALDAIIAGEHHEIDYTGSFALDYDPGRKQWTVEGKEQKLTVLAASRATAEALAARSKVFKAFEKWSEDGAQGKPRLALRSPKPVEDVKPIDKARAFTAIFDPPADLRPLPAEEEHLSTTTTALVIPEFDKDATPWEQLVQTYARVDIEYPELRAVTLAQWIIESGWGTSKLATTANNFGGLKFDKHLGEDVQKFQYGRSAYCSFDSPAHFIEGYWRFIDNNKRIYGGWREAAERGGALGYLRHIVQRGYLGGPQWQKDKYIRQVTGLIPKAQALLE